VAKGIGGAALGTAAQAAGTAAGTTLANRAADAVGASKNPKDKMINKDKRFETKAKPDFLDMDKDGNKKEPMKKAIQDKK
jgi:hypothetical protein